MRTTPSACQCVICCCDGGGTQHGAANMGGGAGRCASALLLQRAVSSLSQATMCDERSSLAHSALVSSYLDVLGPFAARVAVPVHGKYGGALLEAKLGVGAERIGAAVLRE